jgi:hypothetical protein
MMGLLGSIEAQTGAVQGLLTDKISVSTGVVFSVIFPVIMIAMRLITVSSVKDK